jgi:DNA-binding transcriptional ArsR family regulator
MTSDSVPEEKTVLDYPEGLPESKVRSYLTITDPDLVDSFLDPVRRAILVTLRTGVLGKKKETNSGVVQKDDGTTITTTVVEEKIVKRFWMTVPEIVDNVMGEMQVSKYNCYYHLPKLVEQGLVEEFVPEGKESNTKRGIYYRRTSKVFIISSSKMSGDLVLSYINLFKNGFDIPMPQQLRGRLEDLLVRQVEMLDDATEYLAAHLKEVEVDSTTLSDLLTGMSYIFLSDNEEFQENQRELKKIAITPCCGSTTDMKGLCAFCGDPLDTTTYITRVIDGKTHSFCDNDCATSYEKACKA